MLLAVVLLAVGPLSVVPPAAGPLTVVPVTVLMTDLFDLTACGYLKDLDPSL